MFGAVAAQDFNKKKKVTPNVPSFRGEEVKLVRSRACAASLQPLPLSLLPSLPPNRTTPAVQMLTAPESSALPPTSDATLPRQRRHFSQGMAEAALALTTRAEGSADYCAAVAPQAADAASTLAELGATATPIRPPRPPAAAGAPSGGSASKILRLRTVEADTTVPVVAREGVADRRAVTAVRCDPHARVFAVAAADADAPGTVPHAPRSSTPPPRSRSGSLAGSVGGGTSRAGDLFGAGGNTSVGALHAAGSSSAGGNRRRRHSFAIIEQQGTRGRFQWRPTSSAIFDNLSYPEPVL